MGEQISVSVTLRPASIYYIAYFLYTVSTKKLLATVKIRVAFHSEAPLLFRMRNEVGLSGKQCHLLHPLSAGPDEGQIIPGKGRVGDFLIVLKGLPSDALSDFSLPMTHYFVRQKVPLIRGPVCLALRRAPESKKQRRKYPYPAGRKTLVPSHGLFTPKAKHF